MKKLNKLIITEILLDEVLCTVCAVFRDQKVVELRLEPSGKKNTLNNIYVGQVENIAANIQAAFVYFGPWNSFSGIPESAADWEKTHSRPLPGNGMPGRLRKD